MNHCKDCAGFVRKVDAAQDKNTGEMVEVLSAFGECRRHAPVVLGTPRQGMTQSQGWWPVVRENDGCQDFLWAAKEIPTKTIYKQESNA